MVQFQDIDFRLVDAAGYQVRDFFSCDLTDGNDLDEDGMRLSYLGPDCDGIGVEWAFVHVAARA
jgi:hypothetical protein